jgi:hypothetical protein
VLLVAANVRRRDATGADESDLDHGSLLQL